MIDLLDRLPSWAFALVVTSGIFILGALWCALVAGALALFGETAGLIVIVAVVFCVLWGVLYWMTKP